MSTLSIQSMKVCNVFNGISIDTVHTLNSVMCSVVCMLIQLTHSNYNINSNTKYSNITWNFE